MPTSHITISIGDLIVDNYGREAIVLSSDKHPDKKWLAIQEDPRMQLLRDDRWWLAMPLDSGGAVCVPESLAKVLRKATLEDAAGLVEREPSTYVSLVPLFPELKKPE